jgi:hypothetical protein
MGDHTLFPFTNIKHKRYDHGNPPTAIIHISPHTWAITLKPFLFPSQHPYAPSDALAASVPLPIARPQPTTDRQTHESINSGPRRGDAISPPICMKQLPPAFEYLQKVYPTF